MILTHPIHGNHDACYEHEVKDLQKKGWVPQGEPQVKNAVKKATIPSKGKRNGNNGA